MMTELDTIAYLSLMYGYSGIVHWERPSSDQ